MKRSTTLPQFFRSPHDVAGMSKREPVLVALSGGADSVTLIHLMKKYSALVGCKVFAAHVNHGIRTEAYDNEADRDESFCRSLCEELEIELFVEKADIPALSRVSGKSLETEARDARYAFFSEIMEREGIKILCTAHNADDNLETMLFNMARGCGLEGMCGIPPLRALGNGVAVRPILSAAKKEILAYCEENKLSFMTDSTNLEDDCTRNRIRHIIIPELEGLFGSPQRSAHRLSSLLREENELLNDLAKERLRMYCTKNGDNKNASGDLGLELDALRGLPAPLLRRVLCEAFRKSREASLEFTHVEALLKLIESGDGVCALPKKSYAFVSGGELIFSDSRPMAAAKKEQIKIRLEVGKTVLLPDSFALRLGEDGDPKPPRGFEPYAAAKINVSGRKDIFVRYRAEGDRILSNGVHKKLKKLMCDKKIPEEYRDTLPIICDENEIIYVPKCAVADSAKGNQGALKIQVYIKKLRARS